MLLQQEYRRLAETIVTNGWAPTGWTPPLLTLTRLSSHGARRGLWRRWLGCSTITIKVGPYVMLGWVYQLMAHELTHDLVQEPDDVDHGQQFRQFLRRLVRAHWPSVGTWDEVNEPGAKACYREDDRIAAAIQRLYPHVGHQPDRLSMKRGSK
jgi:hypothetical protein